MPDLRPYAGRWVALVANQVAGSGRTPFQARQMASRSRPKEKPQIGFVPSKEGKLLTEIPLSDLLPTLRPLLKNSDEPVYLVGGAVRDALLGSPRSHDLDFALRKGASELARLVADALGGAFFLLDADRGTARVILDKAVLDFARFRGESLLADLHGRDFTINAVALPADSAEVDAIIDPLGGQHDLAAGLIRATGPSAILSDPIRGLRAVRQAAELGFRIQTNTQDLIRSAAPQLSEVSPERIRDEFCRLLIAPHPSRSLRDLDRLDLLDPILPELSRAKGVTQSSPHQVDVFEHSMLVLEQLDTLLAALDAPPLPGKEPLALARDALTPFWPPLSKYLLRSLPGKRQGRMLLYIAALLHDIGKPSTRSTDPDQCIHFIGHEQVGAEMARHRARELVLSISETRQIGIIVHHHLRPGLLAKSSPDGTPSRRAIFRFFRDTGHNGLDVCLLSLADGLGKGAPPDTEGWERRVWTVVALLDHYFNHHQETISPPPLLSGRELISVLKIPPGPIIGQILQLIQESQAAGEVSTRADAMTLARHAYESTDQQ